MPFRKSILALFIGFQVAVAAATAPAAETTSPSIQHRFMALDFWKRKLYYIDQKDSARNWEMPWAGSIRDFQLVGKNRLLITNGLGFDIYDLESKKAVESVKIKESAAVMTARRLADGRTLLGANLKKGAAIFELDAGGKVTRTIQFPQLKWLRMMRLTPQGNLLLSEWDGCTEVTIAPNVPEDQRIIRRFKLPRPRNAYMALRKPDGNTLVAGGYAAGLFEYTPDGKLLRELLAPQPQGMRNWFYAGLQILKNGNIVQTNWRGHGAKDYKPGLILIEFNPEGKVVWTWYEPPEKIGSINGVIILDDLDTQVLNDDSAGILGR